MIVKINRSGGFAGIQENLGTINTDSLPEEQARRIEDTVTDLIHIQEQEVENPPMGADMFQYEIEIEDESRGRKKLVIVDEGDETNPSVRALHRLLGAR